MSDALSEELDTPIQRDQSEFRALARTSSRHVGDTRWTEVRVFRHESEALYRAIITGKSTREGEVDRTKLVDTPSVEALVLALTVKAKDDSGNRYLTAASRQALIEASELDDTINDFVAELDLDGILTF